MPHKMTKRRSLVTLIIGISALFSIIFVLLYGCGYAILQYHLEPNVTIRFVVEHNSYKNAAEKIILFSQNHKMKHVIINTTNMNVAFKSIDMGNAHVNISSYIYLHLNRLSRDNLFVSFYKSRIPGLRLSNAQMEAMIEEIITTLGAVEGVHWERVEYFNHKGEITRTKRPQANG